MTKKTLSSDIGLFIESVDQVLNSNTVYIQYNLPSPNFNLVNYIQNLFISGKFYDSFMLALNEAQSVNEQKTITNIELKLLPISFIEFKKILVDMLAVKKVYFHDSPYKVDLGEKTIQFVVDNFIEASLNYENAEPYYNNIKQIEDAWHFYSMPRHYVNEGDDDREFLQNVNGQMYRPMSKINNDNFLGRNYFMYLGLDSFLVFHNKKRIVFLMTNGSD